MAQQASKLITWVQSKDSRQDERPCGLPCTIFRWYRWSREGLRVLVVLRVQWVCTRRHTLLGSAAFRGQAEVRPSPRWPCEGTAEGQEEAAGLGRASQSPGSPLEGHLAALCKGSGTGLASTSTVTLTPACPLLQAPAGAVLSLLHWGPLPGCWGPKNAFSSAVENESLSLTSCGHVPRWQATLLEPKGPCGLGVLSVCLATCRKSRPWRFGGRGASSSSLNGVRWGCRPCWKLKTGTGPEVTGLGTEADQVALRGVPSQRPSRRCPGPALSGFEPQTVPGTYRKVRPRCRKGVFVF